MVGGGVPSDYLVSTQIKLWLFCCWGCGCCWAVTIRTHAQQLTQGSLDLIDIYIEATKDPFSYLFINLTQECQPQVKYLSKQFDYDHSV